MKKAHIIGLGLLGGSFSLALKRIKPGITISGFDQNSQHLDEALSLGIIDKAKPHANQDTDLIVLATPVHTITSIARQILENIGDDTLVMDFGSTKENICASLSHHPKRGNFLAAHPIAGTEYSGPRAAFEDLLIGKIMILCELEKTKLPLKSMVFEIFEGMGMQLRFMDPKEHDLHLAFVSHLSHISSFMLGKTVLDKMEDDKNLLNMAGSGFASTVRLAKSSPAMWAPIMKENKKNILEALDRYIQNLSEFRDDIEQDNYDELFDKIRKINQIGEILDLKK